MKLRITIYLLILKNFFRPTAGEIRQIHIEKSTEALGITIKENQTKKGVFVSSVSESSLANQVCLQVCSKQKLFVYIFFAYHYFFPWKQHFFFSPSKVGDQLLDVCGINLRSSGEEHAKLILQNSGKSIYMKVQYNPVDYHSMLALGKRKNHNSNALIIQYKPRS